MIETDAWDKGCSLQTLNLCDRLQLLSLLPWLYSQQYLDSRGRVQSWLCSYPAADAWCYVRSSVRVTCFQFESAFLCVCFERSKGRDPVWRFGTSNPPVPFLYVNHWHSTPTSGLTETSLSSLRHPDDFLCSWKRKWEVFYCFCHVIVDVEAYVLKAPLSETPWFTEWNNRGTQPSTWESCSCQMVSVNMIFCHIMKSTKKTPI